VPLLLSFPLLLLLVRGEAPAAAVGEAFDAGDDSLDPGEAFSLFCFMRICALAIRPELMVVLF